MAYSTPPNFAAGAILTEANLDVLGNDIVFLANPPKCRVYNSAAISVPNAALTTLTFNSERYDTDTMHSTAVNTSRITFTTAGTYHFFGNVEFAGNASGYRQLAVIRNGATYIANDQAPSIGATGMGIAISGTFAFGAGDYIELQAQQTSGGALDVQVSGNYSPEFGATWVSL